MGIRYPLIALAAGMLALGNGCMSTDTKKVEAKRPDVMQPGVLPPPQETTRVVSPGAPDGPVVPASATMPVGPVGAAPAPTGVGSSLSKLTGKPERKLVANEMALGWQNRVAYLPDPLKNGRMSPGLVGQMFLFGGPKMEFAQADGVLTVDLIDESPRPAGQPAATPERWQFPKEVLKNLQTRDETFGKSYVVFLPWPAYKPDITRVRISARYDPETGHTLFATPSTVTLDTSSTFGAPVWSDKANGSGTGAAPGNRAQSFGGPSMTGMGGMPAGGALAPNSGAMPAGGTLAPNSGAMFPIQNASGPAPMMPIPSGAAPVIPIQKEPLPLMPIQHGPLPINPNGAPFQPSGASSGMMPLSPAAVPEGQAPLTFTVPVR